jgi:hypothetical protein
MALTLCYVITLMLTLDLEIQNDMYFSVDRSQWRYDES